MSDDQRSLSEMRNIGPACEAHLNAAGIFTEEDIVQLGVEETYERMVAAQMKTGKRVVIHPGYLYAIYGALEDCDWREVPASKKNEFKAICDRLRRKYLNG